jgi:hypothetical protein
LFIFTVFLNIILINVFFIYLLIFFITGHYDAAFSRGKDFIYNANSLKNAESHLRDTHFLDKGGDTWRVTRDSRPQASGPIDRRYKRVIPFREIKFKNAFLEWVILDNVKHRKAAYIRLRRAFKIANAQAAKKIPSYTTVGKWIYDMFTYFEPEVIKEIRTARSRISISFNG